MLWIGIERRQDNLYISCLNKQKKIFCVLSSHQCHLTKAMDLLRALSSKDRTTIFVAGLPASQVLCKTLSLSHSRTALQKILPFQIEPLLPFSQEEACIAIQKTSPITLFLAQKTTISSYQTELEAHGIVYDCLSSHIAALARFAYFALPQEHQLAVLHIDAIECCFIHHVKGFPQYSYAFSMTPLLLQELARLFMHITKEMPHIEKRVLLTGTAASSEIVQYLEQELEWKVHTLSEELSTFAISIGLALDGAFHHTSAYFQTENTHKSSYDQKQNRSLMRFATWMCGAISTLILMSSLILHIQKNAILHELALCKTYPKETSISHLQTELLHAQRTLTTYISPYRLSYSIPNVSALLAWLSTYPASIHIQKINYELISRPTISNKTAAYVGKVTLNIKIQDPMEATSFCESLSQQGSLMDFTKEWSWEEKAPLYHLSFFLESL